MSWARIFAITRQPLSEKSKSRTQCGSKSLNESYRLLVLIWSAWSDSLLQLAYSWFSQNDSESYILTHFWLGPSWPLCPPWQFLSSLEQPVHDSKKYKKVPHGPIPNENTKRSTIVPVFNSIQYQINGFYTRGPEYQTSICYILTMCIKWNDFIWTSYWTWMQITKTLVDPSDWVQVFC